MKELIINGVFYLALAALVTLILLPILYTRALRRREKNASLRQFVLLDPRLRQGLLKEQKRKTEKAASPEDPSGAVPAPADPPPSKEKH
jgi:hypothetical protein